jgi:tRNA 2-thiouridine synthesizing protein A
MLNNLKMMNRSSIDLLRVNVVKMVDTRGMACPYPSFETVKAMNSISPGGVLEILTDSNESAFESIPSVCEKRRWEFLVLEESKHVWRIRIKK